MPRLRGREVRRFDGLALGGLTSAVVARRRDDGGMAGELLGGGEIHAGVEQVGDDDGWRVATKQKTRLSP